MYNYNDYDAMTFGLVLYFKITQYVSNMVYTIPNTSGLRAKLFNWLLLRCQNNFVVENRYTYMEVNSIPSFYGFCL